MSSLLQNENMRKGIIFFIQRFSSLMRENNGDSRFSAYRLPLARRFIHQLARRF